MSQHLTLQERNQIATLITEKGLNMNAVELARLKNLLDIWEHVKDDTGGGMVSGVSNLPEPVPRGYSGMKVFFATAVDTARGETVEVATADTVLDAALPHLRVRLQFRKNTGAGSGYTVWVHLPTITHYVPPNTSGLPRGGADAVYWNYGVSEDLNGILTINPNDRELFETAGNTDFPLLHLGCNPEDPDNRQSADVQIPPFVASLVDGQYLLDIRVKIELNGAMFNIGYTYLSGYTNAEQTLEAINNYNQG